MGNSVTNKRIEEKIMFLHKYIRFITYFIKFLLIGIKPLPTFLDVRSTAEYEE